MSNIDRAREIDNLGGHATDIAKALDEAEERGRREEREAILEFVRPLILHDESFARGGQQVGTRPHPAMVKFAKEIVQLIEASCCYLKGRKP